MLLDLNVKMFIPLLSVLTYHVNYNEYLHYIFTKLHTLKNKQLKINDIPVLLYKYILDVYAGALRSEQLISSHINSPQSLLRQNGNTKFCSEG